MQCQQLVALRFRKAAIVLDGELLHLQRWPGAGFGSRSRAAAAGLFSSCASPADSLPNAASFSWPDYKARHLVCAQRHGGQDGLPEYPGFRDDLPEPGVLNPDHFGGASRPGAGEGRTSGQHAHFPDELTRPVLHQKLLVRTDPLGHADAPFQDRKERIMRGSFSQDLCSVGHVEHRAVLLQLFQQFGGKRGKQLGFVRIVDHTGRGGLDAWRGEGCSEMV